MKTILLLSITLLNLITPIYFNHVPNKKTYKFGNLLSQCNFTNYDIYNHYEMNLEMAAMINIDQVYKFYYDYYNYYGNYNNYNNLFAQKQLKIYDEIDNMNKNKVNEILNINKTTILSKIHNFNFSEFCQIEANQINTIQDVIETQFLFEALLNQNPDCVKNYYYKKPILPDLNTTFEILHLMYLSKTWESTIKILEFLNDLDQNLNVLNIILNGKYDLQTEYSRIIYSSEFKYVLDRNIINREILLLAEKKANFNPYLKFQFLDILNLIIHNTTTDKLLDDKLNPVDIVFFVKDKFNDLEHLEIFLNLKNSNKFSDGFINKIIKIYKEEYFSLEIFINHKLDFLIENKNILSELGLIIDEFFIEYLESGRFFKLIKNEKYINALSLNVTTFIKDNSYIISDTIENEYEYYIPNIILPVFRIIINHYYNYLII